jgi:hypothetical protein
LSTTVSTTERTMLPRHPEVRIFMGMAGAGRGAGRRGPAGA